MNKSQFKKVFRSIVSVLPIDRIYMRSGDVYILNLHSVDTHINPYWPAITPEDFEWMIERLSSFCDFMTLADSNRANKSRKPTVILSFDDGYKNYSDIVVPILAKKGIPSNLNIIGYCVTSGRPPWNVELTDFLESAPSEFFSEIKTKMNFELSEPLTFEAKETYGASLSKKLKYKSRLDRTKDLEWIFQWMNQIDFRRSEMLRKNDLVKLGSDVEIGNHSYRHDSMGPESLEDFIDDIRRCEEVVRSICGHDSEIYSFPNGSWRTEHVDWLMKNGYNHILLVEERPVRELTPVKPRLTCGGSNRGTLRLRFSGLRGLSAWDNQTYDRLRQVHQNQGATNGFSGTEDTK